MSRDELDALLTDLELASIDLHECELDFAGHQSQPFKGRVEAAKAEVLRIRDAIMAAFDELHRDENGAMS